MKTFSSIKIIIYLFLLTIVFWGCSQDDKIISAHLSGKLFYSTDRNIVLYDFDKKTKKELYSTEGTAKGIFSVDVSPDMTNVICSIHEIGKGEELVFLDTANSKPKTINYSNENSYRGVSWSPDGERIAFIMGSWSNDTPIYHLYLSNNKGTHVKKVSDLNIDFYKPSWSADSTKIAVAGFSTEEYLKHKHEITKKGLVAKGIGIYIIDLESGEAKRVINSGHAPSWSPDGHNIAYYEPVPYSNLVNLMLFNFESKGSNTLIKKMSLGNSPAWSSDGSQILYTINKASITHYESHDYEVYSLKTNKSSKVLEAERVNDFVWMQ